MNLFGIMNQEIYSINIFWVYTMCQNYTGCYAGKSEQNLNMCCFHVAYNLVGEASISQIMIPTKMTHIKTEMVMVPGESIAG